MPRSWTEDTARCRAAGIPDSAAFTTKPALAARMIGRALDADVPAPWVAGDEIYGGNPHLRTELETRDIGYVLAVACDHQITTRAGTFRADSLAKKLPKRAWQKLRRRRSQGAPLLQLDPGRHRRQPARPPPTARPPQPANP